MNEIQSEELLRPLSEIVFLKKLHPILLEFIANLDHFLAELNSCRLNSPILNDKSTLYLQESLDKITIIVQETKENLSLRFGNDYTTTLQQFSTTCNPLPTAGGDTCSPNKRYNPTTSWNQDLQQNSDVALQKVNPYFDTFPSEYNIKDILHLHKLDKIVEQLKEATLKTTKSLEAIPIQEVANYLDDILAVKYISELLPKIIQEILHTKTPPDLHYLYTASPLYIDIFTTDRPIGKHSVLPPKNPRDSTYI